MLSGVLVEITLFWYNPATKYGARSYR